MDRFVLSLEFPKKSKCFLTNFSIESYKLGDWKPPEAHSSSTEPYMKEIGGGQNFTPGADSGSNLGTMETNRWRLTLHLGVKQRLLSDWWIDFIKKSTVQSQRPFSKLLILQVRSGTNTAKNWIMVHSHMQQLTNQDPHQLNQNETLAFQYSTHKKWVKPLL